MSTSVLHLCTNDRSGGAALAAYRLHAALLGSGIKSRMLVRNRSTDDEEVAKIAKPKSFWARFQYRVDRLRLRRDYHRPKQSLLPKLEMFSSDRVPGPGAFGRQLPVADAYHLHWVSNHVDYGRFFGGLSPFTPVVWTLHDMNPFTGGCHYAFGCEKFLASCGACAQLGSRHENDLSRRIHSRKARALSLLDPMTTQIAAPSNWIAQEAKRSSLFRRFSVQTIPNGVNCDVFQPRNRALARELFQLPADHCVILFVADSVANYRKGFDLLQAALKDLAVRAPVRLAAIGRGRDGSWPADTALLGRIDNERLMSFAYSAADIFVAPTRADNLPNVILEAMACGIPVVSFDVGGVPDLTRPGRTGLLASQEDIAGLRRAIETLLQDQPMRARMAAECRRVAVSEYALEVQASRYKGVYEQLIDASQRLRSSANIR